MRILLLTHAFNSLTQRLFVELKDKGHDVSVEFDINDTVAAEAVTLYQPDLIIAPFLKRAIPESIWRKIICLIVHPGIRGDRGPSSLDWAILNQQTYWGVTVLQANADMDAGDIWAYSEFPMREASKASLYRSEVSDAAVACVMLAVARFSAGDFMPQPLNALSKDICSDQKPPMQQHDREINWQQDKTETVLRKIRSADGFPGVRDNLLGRSVFLYDARPENSLHGEAGEVIAKSGDAICCATIDGAIWIGHLRDKQAAHPFKLPATNLLVNEVSSLPEIVPDRETGYRDIWYEHEGDVSYLYFPFYNGAMSTQQCERLLQVYIEVCQCDTRVVVLMGGEEFWSNGMHLNLIEAADSAADESSRNINAIDDLAAQIINTTSHITVAALRGNAGAGGVFLARAADLVWAHAGVILNPHYKDMGNLYGSEYWTYLLPRYAGEEHAKQIINARLPMGVREATELGLLDAWFGSNKQDFERQVVVKAKAIATGDAYKDFLEKKNLSRQHDEAEKPLDSYRDEELQKMELNFYGFDPSYHIARYNFVYKVPKSRTPLTIATHRRVDSVVKVS